jgi:hypothetical protein
MTIKEQKAHKPNYSAEQINNRLEQSPGRIRARKKKQYENALKTLNEIGDFINISQLLIQRIEQL